MNLPGEGVVLKSQEALRCSSDKDNLLNFVYVHFVQGIQFDLVLGSNKRALLIGS